MGETAGLWWGALALTLVTVLVFLSLFKKKPLPEPEPIAAPASRTCPLCGSFLHPGEKVRSIVFATRTSDKIMEISGCPNCNPQSPGPKARFCPVCKKELCPADVVTARVFERENGRKTHVHVLGCPRCREDR